VIELDKGVGGPKRQLQLLTRDHFSRPLDKQSEKTKRLLLQLDLATIFPHLTR